MFCFNVGMETKRIFYENMLRKTRPEEVFQLTSIVLWRYCVLKELFIKNFQTNVKSGAATFDVTYEA